MDRTSRASIVSYESLASCPDRPVPRPSGAGPLALRPGMPSSSSSPPTPVLPQGAVRRAGGARAMQLRRDHKASRDAFARRRMQAVPNVRLWQTRAPPKPITARSSLYPASALAVAWQGPTDSDSMLGNRTRLRRVRSSATALFPPSSPGLRASLDRKGSHHAHGALHDGAGRKGRRA